MSKAVRVLDCTLRDGGYRNNWQFGKEAISGALGGLCDAGLDYVECGFLADEESQPGRTVFGDVAHVRNLLPQNATTRFVAMAVWGQYDFTALPPAADSGLFGLRLSFDRHQAAAALADAALLKAKGYAVFLQPVRLTTNYTNAQLEDLLYQVNTLAPYAFYVVDSLGVLEPKDAQALHKRVCGALSPGIRVGFHGHNHRQLALACALALVDAETDRPLLIDSCLGGMGKAAGNVPTEMLLHALAQRGRAGYRLEGALAALDALGPVADAGDTVPWFLASAAGCNTAYTSWLLNHGVTATASLYAALNRLLQESRPFFDEAAAQRLIGEERI